MNAEQMRSLVSAARIARLATIDEGGVPHLVPVTYVLEGETLYWAIDEKPKSGRDLRRMANIRADPRVAVIVDHYDEDWSRLWWVRMRGSARPVEAGPERERALDGLRQKYGQYRDMELGQVVAVDVVEWRGWAAGPIE